MSRLWQNELEPPRNRHFRDTIWFSFMHRRTGALHGNEKSLHIRKNIIWLKFVFSCRDKPRHLGALVLCLPHLPPPLLTPHLPALLPLLNRALLLQVNRHFRPVSVSWNRYLNLRNLNFAEPEYITVWDPDLDPDLTLNGINKSRIKWEANFLRNNVASYIERQDFVNIFCCCAKYCLSGTGTKSFLKLELEPQQIITFPQHRSRPTLPRGCWCFVCPTCLLPSSPLTCQPFWIEHSSFR